MARIARNLIPLAVMLVVSGCAAAAAGAGAAAGIHMTGNSASSMVNASLAEADQRAQAALAALGVQVTERQAEDDGYEYQGTVNDLQVSVELDRQSSTTTRVTASARRSAVEWDNDYARRVVERIVSGR